MADRIRELESQQTAGEAAAWSDLATRIADAVYDDDSAIEAANQCMGVFDAAAYREAQATVIAKVLADALSHPRPRVGVTEAMVRAACKEYTRQYGVDERMDADVAKAILTAALSLADSPAPLANGGGEVARG